MFGKEYASILADVGTWLNLSKDGFFCKITEYSSVADKRT